MKTEAIEVGVFEHPFQRTLIRIWAAVGLILFVLTWRLWTPQTLFPQVPLFEYLVDATRWLDWLAAGLIAMSLTAVVVLPGNQNARVRWACAAFVAGLLLSISLDQHRLQPWAWHWLIFAVLLSTTGHRQFSFWARWIVISIYFYSAISKFDYQFGHTLGKQFLNVILGLNGGDLSEWSDDAIFKIVMLLPLAELLVGVGLMFSRTRRAAVCAGISMHLALLVVLGPFGLNQKWPVLVWNLFFVFQLVWLFGLCCRPPAKRKSGQRKSGQRNAGPTTGANWIAGMLAHVFAIFVLLLPMTSYFGGCDHWLAWELYAPRSSRVTIELPQQAIASLPKSAQQHVRESTIPSVYKLDLASWSLETLNVPVYPHARFQLGAALALSAEADVRVTIKSQSDRWTGRRDQEVSMGVAELRKAASQFRLNASPRTLGFTGH